MKYKALTIAALLGVFLAGSNAYAWSNFFHGYNKHHTHRIHRHNVVYVAPTYVKPSTLHTHPANGLTNDTHHRHPNGLNHHVHTYGACGHTHGGHSYAVCPYTH